MDRVIKIENPELVDRVINQIQDGLANNLPWLNHVFGRAERLVKSINGKKYYEPHSYISGNSTKWLHKKCSKTACLVLTRKQATDSKF